MEKKKFDEKESPRGYEPLKSESDSPFAKPKLNMLSKRLAVGFRV